VKKVKQAKVTHWPLTLVCAGSQDHGAAGEHQARRRTVIERSFSVLDSFKTLLIRFEIAARNWESWNIIGFIVHFIKTLQKRKKL
jgi:hypothetical protein